MIVIADLHTEIYIL